MGDYASTTRFGMAWGWDSRSGKPVRVVVDRAIKVPGKGAVLIVATADERIEVFVSDAGKRIRVWRDGKELVEGEGS